MTSLENDSDDDFHSLCSRQSQAPDGDAPSTIMEPPVHPVPCLQRPFEESILESADQYEVAILNNASDAQERRRKLLEAEFYDDSWTARWQQRPEAQHHPLIKLMAQIVFGLHLLQQEQAKSDEEVVKILQGHVNDVDSFLEQTAEDFDLAIEDVKDRIRHMRLPMAEENIIVFDKMLRDRKFRKNLLGGNAKIESIVDRTERATNATMSDISRGVESMKELASYLNRVRDQYPAGRKDVADIFDAMRGNERGWSKYLSKLKAKKVVLSKEIIALRTIMHEIADLVTEASRRHKASAAPSSRATKSGSPSTTHKSTSVSPDVRSKFSQSVANPSTGSPSSARPLSKAPIFKPHPVPFETRYEQPRQGPPVPSGRRSPVSPLLPSDSPPRTRSRPSIEQGLKHGRAESGNEPRRRGLALRLPTPLGSHPPDLTVNGQAQQRKTTRSQSQGTPEPFHDASVKLPKHAMSFSVNQIRPVTHTCGHSGGNTRTSGSQHLSQPFLSQSVGETRVGQKAQTWTSGSALARRISKRLRNERIPAHENPFTDPHEPSPRPIDSAHSAEAERRLDFNGVPYADLRNRKVSYPFPTTYTEFDPNNTDFGVPLNSLPPKVIAQINGIKTRNSQSVPRAKAGRTMSIRKFFHIGVNM